MRFTLTRLHDYTTLRERGFSHSGERPLSTDNEKVRRALKTRKPRASHEI